MGKKGVYIILSVIVCPPTTLILFTRFVWNFKIEKCTFLLKNAFLQTDSVRLFADLGTLKSSYRF